MTKENNEESVSKKSPSVALIMVCLIIADAVGSFEAAMIYAALKSIIEEFGKPISAGWLIASYLLVSTLAAAICGRLGDMYGRKKTLIFVLAMAFTGSLISAISSDFALIVIGRAMQGLAGAVLPLCYALVKEHIPLEKVSTCIGWLASAAGIGGALGLTAGGIVVDYFQWRSIFVVSAVATVLAALIVLFFIPRSEPGERPRGFSIASVLLFAPAISGLLLAISWILDDRVSQGQLLLTFFASFGLLAGWVVHELNCESPLINLRQLARRDVIFANLGVFFAGMGPNQNQQIFALLLQQPIWAGVGFGLSATLAGALKLPSSVAGAIIAPISGYLSGIHGERRILLLASATTLIVWSVLTFHHSSLVAVVILFLIGTCANTVVMLGAAGIVVHASPPENVGETTGTLVVVRSAGHVLGAQLITLFLSLSLVSNPLAGPGSFPSAQAFQIAAGYVVLTCATTFLAFLFLPRERKSQGPSAQPVS